MFSIQKKAVELSDKTCRYEPDHLHPESRFRQNEPFSVSNDDWMKWCGNRNRLPNLHSLEWITNRRKSDMSLIDFYNSMTREQKTTFNENAMIPKSHPEVSLVPANAGKNVKNIIHKAKTTVEMPLFKGDV